LNKYLLNKDEEVPYNKVLICTNKALIIDLGRYLDKVKYEWFSKIKYLYIFHVLMVKWLPQ
jgi:hypothetical protein